MNQIRRRFLFIAAIAIAAVALPFSAHAADSLKIGIIGSGKVGSALGSWRNSHPSDTLRYFLFKKLWPFGCTWMTLLGSIGKQKPLRWLLFPASHARNCTVEP